MRATAANPIALTFSLLGESETSSVNQVLLAALDVPREPIQLAAAEAIIKRPIAQTRLQLLRRLPDLPSSVHRLVRHAAAPLDPAFRQFLLLGNSETRETAMEAIRLTEQYLQIGHLLELLQRPNGADTDAVADTIRHLTDRLYDRWQAELRGEIGGFVVHGIRQSFLGALERALNDWEHLAHREELAECLLVLAEPAHPAAKQMLWYAAPQCREVAARLILSSQHPGVMRLTAESLREQYPHPKVFEAIRTRQDPEFIATLIRVVLKKRSSQVLEHLHQIQHLEWVRAPYDELDSVPPTLQPSLIAFINATRLPRETKAGVQEWMLRFGTPEGKRAATDGTTLISGDVIQEVVREGLDSDDEGVQAWATSQLREHAIPQAYSLLIERLDSELPAVRDAARQELAAFSVERVLPLADEMPQDDAQRAGVLVMKVDVEASTKIRRALAHPASQKRLLAARRIARLGLQRHFLSAYVSLADDSDPSLRRLSADVLATIPDLDAYRALVLLADDVHPRVRESATAALERWGEQRSAETDTDRAVVDPIIQEAVW